MKSRVDILNQLARMEKMYPESGLHFLAARIAKSYIYNIDHTDEHRNSEREYRKCLRKPKYTDMPWWCCRKIDGRKKKVADAAMDFILNHKYPMPVYAKTPDTKKVWVVTRDTNGNTDTKYFMGADESKTCYAEWLAKYPKAEVKRYLYDEIYDYPYMKFTSYSLFL